MIATQKWKNKSSKRKCKCVAPNDVPHRHFFRLRSLTWISAQQLYSQSKCFASISLVVGGSIRELANGTIAISAHSQVRYGSKCEELNLSKSSPPCLAERTSIRCATTSLMGQKRDITAASLLSASARGLRNRGSQANPWANFFTATSASAIKTQTAPRARPSRM